MSLILPPFAKPVLLPRRSRRARRKSVLSIKSTVPNGRIYLDFFKIKAPKDLDVAVTRSNWRLVVNAITQLKISDFFGTKDAMVEPTYQKINQWKLQGKPVKIVCMDNTGENLKLAEEANGRPWKLNLEFEYTGNATPPPTQSFGGARLCDFVGACSCQNDWG